MLTLIEVTASRFRKSIEWAGCGVRKLLSWILGKARFAVSQVSSSWRRVDWRKARRSILDFAPVVAAVAAVLALFL